MTPKHAPKVGEVWLWGSPRREVKIDRVYRLGGEQWVAFVTTLDLVIYDRPTEMFLRGARPATASR